MTSDKKVEANRRNALKSTGPRTPEGKAVVRLNALRHGLRSEEILLPGEDGEALRELGESLRAKLQPVGALENLLVDRIIAAHWRPWRAGRVETGIFAWSELDSETAALGLTFIRDANGANAFSKLSRYGTAIERQLYRALHELERRQAARGGAALTPPQVVDVEVSGLPEEG